MCRPAAEDGLGWLGRRLQIVHDECMETAAAERAAAINAAEDAAGSDGEGEGENATQSAGHQQQAMVEADQDVDVDGGGDRLPAVERHGRSLNPTDQRTTFSAMPIRLADWMARTLDVGATKESGLGLVRCPICRKLAVAARAVKKVHGMQLGEKCCVCLEEDSCVCLPCGHICVCLSCFGCLADDGHAHSS